jgi:hypothetical protein
MTGAALAALVALVPAMIGPLPLEQGSEALLLAICGGGTIEIAIDGDEGTLPMPATTPCCAKGCRSSDKRRATTGDN